MSAVTSEEIIQAILDREDGYSDREADRGGPTKYGITAAVLGEWRKLGRTASRKEVMNLDVHEAREIYMARYILGPGFDKIPDDDIRAFVVDMGVNLGTHAGGKMFQRAIGLLGDDVDGVVGPQTLHALSLTSKERVMRRLIQARGEFYMNVAIDNTDVQDFLKKHPTSQLHNLRGWIRRTMEFL